MGATTGKSNADFELDQSAAAILNSVAKGGKQLLTFPGEMRPFETKPEVAWQCPAWADGLSRVPRRCRCPVPLPQGHHGHPGNEQRPCVLGPREHTAPPYQKLTVKRVELEV